MLIFIFGFSSCNFKLSISNLLGWQVTNLQNINKKIQSKTFE
jgi:hypothetical protein